MNSYQNMHIITQGNTRTSEGEIASVLTKPSPIGFGLTEAEVGKADRFIIRATDFSHSEQFTICELYEGESLTPAFAEKILGY